MVWCLPECKAVRASTYFKRPSDNCHRPLLAQAWLTKMLPHQRHHTLVNKHLGGSTVLPAPQLVATDVHLDATWGPGCNKVLKKQELIALAKGGRSFCRGGHRQLPAQGVDPAAARAWQPFQASTWTLTTTLIPFWNAHLGQEATERRAAQQCTFEMPEGC